MTLAIPTYEPCPFCEYLAGIRPCAFVTRGPEVSALMNRTQYERGGLLVLPNRHVTSLLDADEELVAAVHREARRLAQVVVDVLGASGVNVFNNNGIKAGQTVPHYHVHVVPRYASSDPDRIFRQADFETTSLDVLNELAGALKNALP